MGPFLAVVCVVAGALGAITGYLLARKNSLGPHFATTLFSLDSGYFLLYLLVSVRGAGPFVAGSLPPWLNRLAISSVPSFAWPTSSARDGLPIPTRTNQLPSRRSSPPMSAGSACIPPGRKWTRRPFPFRRRSSSPRPLKLRQQTPSRIRPPRIPPMETEPAPAPGQNPLPTSSRPSVPEPETSPGSSPRDPLLDPPTARGNRAWGLSTADSRPTPRPKPLPEPGGDSLAASAPAHSSEPLNGHTSGTLAWEEFIASSQPPLPPQTSPEPVPNGLRQSARDWVAHPPNTHARTGADLTSGAEPARAPEPVPAHQDSATDALLKRLNIHREPIQLWKEVVTPDEPLLQSRPESESQPMHSWEESATDTPPEPESEPANESFAASAADPLPEPPPLHPSPAHAWDQFVADIHADPQPHHQSQPEPPALPFAAVADQASQATDTEAPRSWDQFVSHTPSVPHPEFEPAPEPDTRAASPASVGSRTRTPTSIRARAGGRVRARTRA